MFFKNKILMKLKRKFQKKNQLIKGIVKKNYQGFGFLETIKSKKHYFISKKYMKKVLHGDKIYAKIIIKNNKKIAIPKKLINSFLKKFVGYIKKINNIFYIVPKNFFFNEFIEIFEKDIKFFFLKSGDWFIAKLEKHKLNKENIFQAKLIKLISKKKNIFIPWLVILNKYNLDSSEPIISKKKFVIKYKNIRSDLTKVPFITIDNKSTKDIDDAIFIKKLSKKRILLKIAIADPTSFINKKDKIDKIALQRSFTHYLPGFNVPMLPRFLSENLCSLKPFKKRPVLVCKMIILKNGSIKKNSTFFLAWIKSHAKLSYENVSNWLENKGSWNPNSKIIENQLILLNNFFHLRYSWRKEHTLIFPENKDYKFKISDSGEILNVYQESRRIAHKIVEESMIAANISAAKIFSKKKNFGIYNTHSGFDINNAKKVSHFLLQENINISYKQIITLRGYQRLYNYLISIKNYNLIKKIQKFQSLGELSYSPKPHYALGLKVYATWTSPIRKYTDIINHRFLKSIILKKNYVENKYKKLSKINEKKRKHKLAFKEVENWLYAIFLKDKKNFKKFFLIEIIDIYKLGIKGKIIENGAIVFIPKIYMRKKKYILKTKYKYDLKKKIVFKNNKIVFKIFDIIKVCILHIESNTHRIIAKIID
ncbi:exoribonuclease II [Buchnera aphidicola]|uniref:exoribonuclease II n=1 Tax=Buchnera aphidicola TaxID=9 RepID=UPI0030EB6F79